MYLSSYTFELKKKITIHGLPEWHFIYPRMDSNYSVLGIMQEFYNTYSHLNHTHIYQPVIKAETDT